MNVAAIPGRAALVMVNVDELAAKGAMWEGPFEERAGDEPQQHPIARAWALWDSTKDDWPGWSATVIANDRAKNLAAAYRMSRMGFDYDEALADYETGVLDATARAARLMGDQTPGAAA